MARRAQRQGFTLVEVLLVVVIMAILAATVVSQFNSSTDDAKVSSLRFNLNAIRSQVELYKAQHNGVLPTVTSGGLPQLTGTTNAAGATGTGSSYPYGPYLVNGVPANPLNGVKTVTVTTDNPPTASTATGGWFYNETTGGFWANSSGHLAD